MFILLNRSIWKNSIDKENNQNSLFCVSKRFTVTVPQYESSFYFYHEFPACFFVCIFDLQKSHLFPVSIDRHCEKKKIVSVGRRF